MGIESAKVLRECMGHSMVIAANGMENLME